ncbi:hypothetical protein FGIG_08516 [Fasciola gigantica]|uniref:POU domain protein n=1 Tax=Fasciola gigantica TaxID=46835 RepID=A0A504YA02_FASGI|nr:hypothetical protein FGIG_08516 [Fasciola gigantica]
MGSYALSDNITLYDPLQEPFAAYITFINDDGCKIHVPVPPANRKDLFNLPEASFLEDLNSQLEEECRNMGTHGLSIVVIYRSGIRSVVETQFRILSKSARSPALPGEYALILSTPAQSNRNLRSSQVDSPSKQNEKTARKTVDLSNPRELVEAFIARRNEMKLGQRDVAQSLKLLYNIDRSPTFIHRFETMSLSVSNFVVVRPVIRQWLKDTESVESRDSIVRAVTECDSSRASNKPLRSKPVSTSVTLPKRRARTIMTKHMRKILEATFLQNPVPSREARKELAENMGLDAEVIRVWFCNRRHKERRRFFIPS